LKDLTVDSITTCVIELQCEADYSSGSRKVAVTGCCEHGNEYGCWRNRVWTGCTLHRVQSSGRLL